jgi:hypothetical protein
MGDESGAAGCRPGPGPPSSARRGRPPCRRPARGRRTVCVGEPARLCHRSGRALPLPRCRTRSKLRLQRLQSPTRWRAAHELLAEAFRTWRTGREKSLPAAEHWNDAAWREHRYNKICRRLCAGPCRALPDALTQTVHACGHGSATARGWTPLLAQAGTDAEDDGLQARAERLTGACRDGTAAVLTVLEPCSPISGSDTAGQLRARIVRGRLYRRAERNEAALACLTAALALDLRHEDVLVQGALTCRQSRRETPRQCSLSSAR